MWQDHNLDVHRRSPKSQQWADLGPGRESWQQGFRHPWSSCGLYAARDLPDRRVHRDQCSVLFRHDQWAAE